MGRKLGSSIPPWLLLWFLPPGSCLEFLSGIPALTSLERQTIACKLKQMCPSPNFLVVVFYCRSRKVTVTEYIQVLLIFLHIYAYKNLKKNLWMLDVAHICLRKPTVKCSLILPVRSRHVWQY